MTDKISNTKLYIMTTNIGLVKIGVSKTVESRLETLKLVSPFEVDCAAVVDVVGTSKDVYKLEKYLHDIFRYYLKNWKDRFDGYTEYFAVHVEDVLHILNNKSGQHELPHLYINKLKTYITELPNTKYIKERDRILSHRIAELGIERVVRYAYEEAIDDNYEIMCKTLPVDIEGRPVTLDGEDVCIETYKGSWERYWCNYHFLKGLYNLEGLTNNIRYEDRFGALFLEFKYECEVGQTMLFCPRPNKASDLPKMLGTFNSALKLIETGLF